MHKLFRTASLFGVAMLAVAGTALAASGASKVMTVNLPDGSLAHIEYQGDVAPQVKIDPPKRLMPPALFDPVSQSRLIFPSGSNRGGLILLAVWVLSPNSGTVHKKITLLTVERRNGLQQSPAQ